MIIKTCPYCDSVMTKKHRCDVCNSFVWKPSEIEGNYKVQASQDEAQPQKSNVVQNQKDTLKKASAVIFLICAAAVIFAVFMESDAGQEIKWAVQDFFEESFDGGKTPETEDASALGETYDWYNVDVENPKENFDSGLWQYESGGEVSEEEVLSKGQECSEHIHFPVQKDTAVSLLMAYGKNTFNVPESDITVSDATSANYVYHTGSSESTVFEQYTHIYFDELPSVISVDCDTVSQNLHSISMMAVSQDRVPEVIRLFVNIAGGEAGEDFIEECMNFGDETYTFTYGDGYRIYVGEETDDDYFIMINGAESEALDF